ncbi:hypothetical protein PG995_005631 [Apiospora arundinis]
MRPFILGSAPGGRQSSRIRPGRKVQRPNPFNDSEPKPSLRQERIEWYRMVEESCAYYLKELVDYQERINELGTAGSSGVPKRVRRSRSYPDWWMKAAEARGERLARKKEDFWQGLDDFGTERNTLAKRIVDLEEEVKAAHAQFSTTGVWDKDANVALVHEYYRVSTEFSWFQADIQHLLRTEKPATTVPPSSATTANEPSLDEYEERMRRKRNWIHSLLCWCRIMGLSNIHFDISEKWWRRFDWVAVITMVLLPFLPTLLAYPSTCYKLACFLSLGYYTWLLMYYSFTRCPESCTVLWPAFYLAPLLTFGAFLSIAASQALFALALPSLTTYADEYTRR